MRIPALTLFQPYATGVALQLKQHETREWMLPVPFRNRPIAIHAAKGSMAKEDRALANQPWMLNALGESRYADGEVVAIVRFTDTWCVPGAMQWPDNRGPASWTDYCLGGWGTGRWIWDIDLLRVLPEPIAARGARKFWDWDCPDALIGRDPDLPAPADAGLPRGLMTVANLRGDRQGEWAREKNTVHAESIGPMILCAAPGRSAHPGSYTLGLNSQEYVLGYFAGRDDARRAAATLLPIGIHWYSVDPWRMPQQNPMVWDQVGDVVTQKGGWL